MRPPLYVLRSISCLLLLLCSGCLWQSKPAETQLEEMNRFARQGRWDDAWQHAVAVLETHDDDPDILAQLAWVAFESNHPNESADLLMAACRAESFRHQERVQQTLVAAIHVGKLFEGVDFLSEAISAQPDQLGTRRLIYDLLMGLEDRTAAQPHGRYLVRKRKFDSELLASLCNTRRNSSNETSWETVVARNPDDQRPLIPLAMTALDDARTQDALEILAGILESHPENMQAHLLLGEALVAGGNFERLNDWYDHLPPNPSDEPEYWITMGKWASNDAEHDVAARSFFEATQRNPLSLEAWSALRRELSELTSRSNLISTDEITAIENRIEQLTRLNRTKTRFVKSRGISRSLAADVALTLVELGRMWEAEAWLSLATTLPEDPNVDVLAARQKVISRLTPDTPWQVLAGHPELQLDVSLLPLPSKDRP